MPGGVGGARASARDRSGSRSRALRRRNHPPAMRHARRASRSTFLQAIARFRRVATSTPTRRHPAPCRFRCRRRISGAPRSSIGAIAPRRARRRDHRRSPRVVPVPRTRRARRRNADVLRRSSRAAAADVRTRGAGVRRVRRRACACAMAASCRRAATARWRCGKAALHEQVTQPDRFVRSSSSAAAGASRISTTSCRSSTRRRRRSRSGRGWRIAAARSSGSARRCRRQWRRPTTGISTRCRSRPRLSDLAILLSRVQVDADGDRRRARPAPVLDARVREHRPARAGTAASGVRRERRERVDRRCVAGGDVRRRRRARARGPRWISSRSASACSATSDAAALPTRSSLCARCLGTGC